MSVVFVSECVRCVSGVGIGVCQVFVSECVRCVSGDRIRVCQVCQWCLYIILVPVFLGDAVERVKEKWHHNGRVLLKEMQNVFIAPVVQGPLCHL